MKDKQDKQYKPLSRKMLKDYLKMRDLRSKNTICNSCFYDTIKLVLNNGT